MKQIIEWRLHGLRWVPPKGSLRENPSPSAILPMNIKHRVKKWKHFFVYRASTLLRLFF